MTVLEEWEAHVRSDNPDVSACGQRLWSHHWVFTGEAHARASIENGSTTLPCPACMAVLDRTEAMA